MARPGGTGDRQTDPARSQEDPLLWEAENRFLVDGSCGHPQFPDHGPVPGQPGRSGPGLGSGRLDLTSLPGGGEVSPEPRFGGAPEDELNESGRFRSRLGRQWAV